MAKRFLISTVAFVGSITFGCIPITAQPNAAPASSIGQSQPKEPDIGTAERPVFVRIPKTQAEATQEQADRERQATTNSRLVWLTGALAAFTLGLIYVGVKQRETYEATLTANKVIERAYVTISDDPHGMRIQQFMPPGTAPAEPLGFDALGITIVLKNDGNTPATISNTVLDTHIGHTLPDVPEYQTPGDRGAQKAAFLVKGASVSTQFGFVVPRKEMNRFMVQHEHFWMLGYVDYIDIFGQRHRAGYARVYSRDPGPNLVFELKPGYNYDRVRHKGEGNDWLEPAG